MVKNPPAVQETWVPSLCWEDPLEKGKGPLDYSGLENLMDCIGHGVAESRTRLSDFLSLTQYPVVSMSTSSISIHLSIDTDVASLSCLQ